MQMLSHGDGRVHCLRRHSDGKMARAALPVLSAAQQRQAPCAPHHLITISYRKTRRMVSYRKTRRMV